MAACAASGQQKYCRLAAGRSESYSIIIITNAVELWSIYVNGAVMMCCNQYRGSSVTISLDGEEYSFQK